MLFLRICSPNDHHSSEELHFPLFLQGNLYLLSVNSPCRKHLSQVLGLIMWFLRIAGWGTLNSSSFLTITLAKSAYNSLCSNCRDSFLIAQNNLGKCIPCLMLLPRSRDRRINSLNFSPGGLLPVLRFGYGFSG